MSPPVIFCQMSHQTGTYAPLIGPEPSKCPSGWHDVPLVLLLFAQRLLMCDLWVKINPLFAPFFNV